MFSAARPCPPAHPATAPGGPCPPPPGQPPPALATSAPLSAPGTRLRPPREHQRRCPAHARMNGADLETLREVGAYSLGWLRDHLAAVAAGGATPPTPGGKVAARGAISRGGVYPLPW